MGAVVFSGVTRIHLALKSVGGTAGVKVFDAADSGRINLLTGNGDAFAVSSATDLYYDITALAGKTVVIESSGDAILSVTNIKTTHKRQNAANSVQFIVGKEMAAQVLAALDPAPVNPFVDIFEGDYYYDPILWAVEKGITNGVDASHFGPAAVCNRAQVVTFLWRAKGCPEPELSEHPFTDVTEGTFYYEPVLWAVAEGITNGTTPTTFGPNDQCMRAHVVTFLWRAAGSPEPKKADNPFADVKPTDFYYKAVLWAVENGVTNGVDATHFGPFLYCNRAQVVTFLYRSLGSPAVESRNNPFTDVPEGQWFTAPVLWAVENGVTNGLSTTAFGPNAICNRAQIVTFLYRAFAK